ncbi:MAG: MOSC domain-containing protein [Vicinamibacteria bacterium]
MTIVGRVASLWRYPVKSMRGEKLGEAFLGFPGIHGDRLFAFEHADSPKEFPYLTGRKQREMLLYRPRFRDMDPAFGLIVDVETPSGEVIAIDDPELMRLLGEGIGGAVALTLSRSDRAMADCHPVSLFSLQTAQQLGEELGAALDERRFRANIYADLESHAGFLEDTFVGRTLRIGSKAVISILEREARCKMIGFDPDTAEPNPEVLRKVALAHEGKAGVYGEVLVEGTIRRGDAIELLG